MSGCSDAHKNQASRLETEGKSMVIFPEMCFFHIPYQDLVQVLGKKKKKLFNDTETFPSMKQPPPKEEGSSSEKKKSH